MEAPLDTPTGRTSTLFDPCGAAQSGERAAAAGGGGSAAPAPACPALPRRAPRRPLGEGAARCNARARAHPHDVDGRVGDGAGEQVLQQVARLDAPKLHVCG